MARQIANSQTKGPGSRYIANSKGQVRIKFPLVAPPFLVDVRSLLKEWRRKLNSRVDGVSISLPFISFKVSPTDLEQKIARELIIRMANRRVLSATECCDNCIEQALESLQGIRSIFEEKQVDLAQVVDSPLYMLLELQLEALRQFLAFEQRLSAKPSVTKIFVASPDMRRPPDSRETYFAALEMLRGHLHRCLFQVAKIADVSPPKLMQNINYGEAWQLEAYEKPLMLD